MKYLFSEAATKDLQGIAYYVALHNQDGAERLINSIFDTCEMITEMPGIGRHPGYLKASDILYVPVKKYGQYQIFYRQKGTVIEILWIVHGARDLPNTLGKN